MKSPQEIIETMLAGDEFSRFLGVEIDLIALGTCKLHAEVTGEMLNGFNLAHGGITYSLADSALAFASNSHGNKCVSIETSISHIRPVKKGDCLHVSCIELHRGRSIGVYQVEIVNQEQKPVAFFKGTVHVSREIW